MKAALRNAAVAGSAKFRRGAIPTAAPQGKVTAQKLESI